MVVYVCCVMLNSSAHSEMSLVQESQICFLLIYFDFVNQILSVDTIFHFFLGHKNLTLQTLHHTSKNVLLLQSEWLLFHICVLFAGPAWCEHWEWSVQPAGFLYAIDSSRNHPSSTFNQCKGAFTLGSIAWSEPKFDCCPLPLPLLDCVHIILFGSESRFVYPVA